MERAITRSPVGRNGICLHNMRYIAPKASNITKEENSSQCECKLVFRWSRNLHSMISGEISGLAKCECNTESPSHRQPMACGIFPNRMTSPQFYGRHLRGRSSRGCRVRPPLGFANSMNVRLLAADDCFIHLCGRGIALWTAQRKWYGFDHTRSVIV